MLLPKCAGRLGGLGMALIKPIAALVCASSDFLKTSMLAASLVLAFAMPVARLAIELMSITFQ